MQFNPRTLCAVPSQKEPSATILFMLYRLNEKSIEWRLTRSGSES